VKQVPGIYAIDVSGVLPNPVIEDLNAAGIPYRCRDGLERQRARRKMKANELMRMKKAQERKRRK
jgi:hypothetical protein